jgi:glycosyltransferase involved in cell wall biosynthesis
MKKRIILTVTNDLTYDQRMQRICTSLHNTGFFVELVGRYQKHSDPIAHQPYLQTRLKCLFNKGILFYAEMNIRLFFFLLMNGFDIVCGCDLDTLPAAVLAAKLKNKKAVYDAHEYFPESPELIGRPAKQRIWKTIEKLLVPHVHAMYTVTPSLAKLFRSKYKTDCRVIANLPVKETALPSEGKYLLYQGAVNIGRGLNEMLLVMLSISDMPLYIAGDGDERPHVEFSVSELKLNSKVKLLGRKTPAALRELTRAACIGINLLENRGLSYYYSLGNKTFDYIQAGIPQVMIGFPEYISLNEKYNIGIVVDELSVEKIEAAIRKLLEDKMLYARLQQNCLTAREVLCWENEEPKLIEIYTSL